MDGGIVKLHALADADGAGTQNHDLLFSGNPGFVSGLIGGVEIGDIAVKFSGAGVDHPIAGEDAILFAKGIDLSFRQGLETGDSLVGEAHFLGFPQNADVTGILPEQALHFHDVSQLAQEEGVNLGGGGNLLNAGAQAEKLSDGIDPVVGAGTDVIQQFLPG